jgi:ribosome-associated toxin RatA of RatAB toxin-antitoxin module
MPKVQHSKIVAYTPSQMCALVCDIEQYPQFIPTCTHGELISRQTLAGNQQQDIASLDFAKGLLRTSFTTRNIIQPNKRIDVYLISGPFKQLSGYWQFNPTAYGGCQVEINMEFSFSNKLLALTVGKVLHKFLDSLVNVFCHRAQLIYPPDEKS